MNNKQTQFFYTITPDKILETVEITGVRCTGKIMALNSLENRVYSVEIETDESKMNSPYDAYRVIKFYRPGRWSKEQIAEEHQFLQELQEEAISVIMPLKFPDGETIYTIKDFDNCGNDLYCAIYPRIGGRLIDEMRDQQVAIIGRLVARLHLVARRKKAQHRITISSATFAHANTDYLYNNQHLPLEISERYLALTKAICSLTDEWLQAVPNHRVHGDLHHGNILWSNNELHLLDFDDFANGPAVQDLWLLISGRDDWQKKQRDLLIDSYAEIIDFDYSSLRLIEPLRALRIINFSAWIARRWEDPAFKNAFPNFGSPQYWREQLIALEEIFQIMQTGEAY